MRYLCNEILLSALSSISAFENVMQIKFKKKELLMNTQVDQGQQMVLSIIKKLLTHQY